MKEFWPDRKKTWGEERKQQLKACVKFHSGFFLPTPSSREMDYAVFISWFPYTSLIISFFFSVCDSFSALDVRILLIVSGKRQTQIPVTHWGYPLLPQPGIGGSLCGLATLSHLPRLQIETTYISGVHSLNFHSFQSCSNVSGKAVFPQLSSSSPYLAPWSPLSAQISWLPL